MGYVPENVSYSKIPLANPTSAAMYFYEKPFDPQL
jgi:hypothetical protein